MAHGYLPGRRNPYPVGPLRGVRPAPGLPRPSPGTYDPAIDASERAAQRGYGDVQTDTAKQNLRAGVDYGVGLADIGRQRDYGLADILRGQTRAGEDVNRQGGEIKQNYERSLASLLQARDRSTADYGTNVQTLQRNYERLGGQQTSGAEAAGVAGGGALMQALQKRTVNQAIERAPIDTGYQRFQADSQLQQTQLGENRDQAVAALDQQRVRGIEDFSQQGSRLTQQLGTGGQDYGQAGEQLSLGYQRGTEDRATALQRAGRELKSYKQDLIPTRFYSAAGLTPYTPPASRAPRRGRR